MIVPNVVATYAVIVIASILIGKPFLDPGNLQDLRWFRRLSDYWNVLHRLATKFNLNCVKSTFFSNSVPSTSIRTIEEVMARNKNAQQTTSQSACIKAAYDERRLS